MGNLADGDPQALRRARVTHPKGYEPGVELGSADGTGVTFVETDEGVPPGLPDEAWLIGRFGLDPDEWAIIDGTLQARQWQRYDGLWLHYYKAGLRRRTIAQRDLIETLRRRVAKRPALPATTVAGAGGFVVLITDTQVGKAEGGGTDAFLSRFSDSVDAAVARLLELRGRGWGLGTVALMFGGDLIENTSGNYAAQPFRVDLCLRDQIEIAALSADYAVERFLAAGVEDLVTCWVPSNHGENRSGKDVATSERDSTDLVIADQLRRVYAGNPDRYGKVQVVVPWGEHTTLSVDIAGTLVGLAHGHQVGRKQIADWWVGQMSDRSRPLADARILCVGHRHHLRVEDVADGRYLVQGPSLEGGSAYWAELTGVATPPGMVTFVVDEGMPREMELIRL